MPSRRMEAAVATRRLCAATMPSYDLARGHVLARGRTDRSLRLVNFGKGDPTQSSHAVDEPTSRGEG